MQHPVASFRVVLHLLITNRLEGTTQLITRLVRIRFTDVFRNYLEMN